jgi:histidine ammonia-lyase
VPAVHGATRDALDHVEQVTYREINSVTDNPLVFEEAILSGGNFHGQPLALTLDYLAIAMAELASISERRQYLLVNDSHYGLPATLMSNSGLNSGFMIAHYTSAALVSENKVLCHPASVDSIPTSGGQEDHVSMGATSALKCWEIVDNVERVLGIELLVAAQALDFTPAAELAPAIRRVLETVREQIPAADADREFGIDIETATALIRSQTVTRTVSESIQCR